MNYSILISLTLSLLLFASTNIFAFSNRNDTSKVESSLPSQYRNVYTLEQDSAFKKALDFQLPFSLRSRLDLELSEPLWRVATRTMANDPWTAAMNSLSSLPPGIFDPRDVEVVQWQTNIMNSFYVPFLKTYSPYGAKVDFETIGKFLGLVEDVSPVIKYNLSITADVEVVIYSIQATVVVTLFKGYQTPGNYTINWNGRDDQGRLMPAGDYIAEVRIGPDRFVRKRILIK